MSGASHQPAISSGRRPATAILLCLLGAGFWGLWWLPVLWIEEQGVSGGYAGLAMHAGALPGVVLVWRLRPGPMSKRLFFGSCLVGLAVTLYSASLVMTDVVRAIVLFYTAPAWGVLIECLFLGRSWSWRSGLAIALSVLGMLVIFRGDISSDGLRAGDWMALMSGLAWAVAMALIFIEPEKSEGPILLTVGCVAILTSALLAPMTATLPSLDALASTAWIALLAGSLFLAPILTVTLWGAFSLPPATISFILTAEIITGVASSAWYLDQQFGWPELTGAILIVSGAMTEVFRPQS